MKVLIQEVETGRYFKTLGVWVDNRHEARAFAGSLDAIDYCVAHELRRVNIVFCFADPRYDIYVCPFDSKSRAPG